MSLLDERSPQVGAAVRETRVRSLTLVPPLPDTAPAPRAPGVNRRVRAGETRRPATRARVVAGRPATRPASCAPRRTPVRWPALAGLAAAVFLAIVGIGLFANAMAGEAPVPANTATVAVAPGDTLSAIAHRFAPDSDTGAVVDRIQQLNHLGDAALTPGTPLSVPVQG